MIVSINGINVIVMWFKELPVCGFEVPILSLFSFLRPHPQSPFWSQVTADPWVCGGGKGNQSVVCSFLMNDGQISYLHLLHLHKINPTFLISQLTKSVAESDMWLKSPDIAMNALGCCVCNYAITELMTSRHHI